MQIKLIKNNQKKIKNNQMENSFDSFMYNISKSFLIVIKKEGKNYKNNILEFFSKNLYSSLLQRDKRPQRDIILSNFRYLNEINNLKVKNQSGKIYV